MSDKSARLGNESEVVDSIVGDDHNTVRGGNCNCSPAERRTAEKQGEMSSSLSSRGTFDRNSDASGTPAVEIDVGINSGREDSSGTGIGMGPGSNEILELPNEEETEVDVRNEDGSFGVPVDR